MTGGVLLLQKYSIRDLLLVTVATTSEVMAQDLRGQRTCRHHLD